MREVLSAVDGKLLAMVYRRDDLLDGPDGRNDLNAPSEPLQIALIVTPDEKEFKAHKHIPNPRMVEMTQEAWYVLIGTVRVSLFDIDDKPVDAKPSVVLNAGDLLVIHRGGHGYHSKGVVLEFKSPQFVGVECDKVLL